MHSFDRCAPLGPHQPVEAVVRAEVRAGALPVLDDPREAGLRRNARIDRPAIWSAMMVAQPPCRSRFVVSAAPKGSQAPHRVRGDGGRGRQFRFIGAWQYDCEPLPFVAPCLTRGLANLPLPLPKTIRPIIRAIADWPSR